MKLRDYQINAIKEIKTHFKTSNHFVLASSPSSGKTVMALEYIKQSKYKTLILTHGQNILKEMWDLSIKNDYPSLKKRVVTGLPQSMYKKKDQYDLIVIDEAHEFTFAEKMTKQILNNNPQAKVLYLTGTPSKFIHANGLSNSKDMYKIHIIPANQLIKDDFISDLYISIAETDLNLKYNSNDDVMDSSIKKLETDKQVNDTMDKLMCELLNRLTATTKYNPNMFRKLKVLPSMGNLGRTLIACASIDQADKVYKYLNNKGISTVVSHSKNDIHSDYIINPKTGFVYDSSKTVLVTVDRGILGFNVPDLENVIDLTCSKNVDRIYQLYARVMRKHPTVKKKFFMKIVPRLDSVNSWIALQCAVSLMFKDFIEKYDGFNLNNMKLLVKNKKTKKKLTGCNRRVLSKKDDKKYLPLPICESFLNEVLTCQFMEDILHKSGSSLSEYSYVTVRQLKNKYNEKQIRESWSLVLILDKLKEYGINSNFTVTKIDEDESVILNANLKKKKK